MSDIAYHYCKNVPSIPSETPESWHFCAVYDGQCAPVGGSTTYPIKINEIEVGPRIPTPDELLAAEILDKGTGKVVE